MHNQPPAEASGIDTRAPLAVLIAALLLGVAGDVLLRATPWGLNFTLWISLLCVAVLALGTVRGMRHPPGRFWLPGAVLFAALFSLRASEVLQFLNAIAAIACFGMVAFHSRSGTLRLAGMSEYAAHLSIGAAMAAYGAARLIVREVRWPATTNEHQRRRALAVGRGLLLAIPLLLVFGALFAAADSFFRDLLADAVVFSPDEFLSHLLIGALVAWLSGSYLWSILLTERAPPPTFEPPGSVRLEAMETGIVFGLIDALFIAFVLVQFRYLFGGEARVEDSSTLTYAEYARRGFFELVAVAAIATALILTAHWFLARHRIVRRLFTVLAGLLVALVFVVMASALERMRLYQDEYGLTELRLYTTAFMGFLAVLLLWVAATVLRGRREQFALGLPVACSLLLLSLAALDPDGFIVEQNLATGRPDRPVDTDYLLALGPDAVEPLVRRLERLPPSQACAVASEVRARYGSAPGDWRTWNLGRWRAERAARDDARLDPACAQPAAP